MSVFQLFTGLLGFNKLPVANSTRKNKINAISLNIGDMCVYKGDELSHWREPYHGDRQLQAFLHYVEVHGKFSHYKYDTRPALGLPNSYRNFGYDLIN
jgi:hypothetical protein